MIDTLEKTDVEEDLSSIDPNDKDKVKHAYRKTDLDAMMFGQVTEITAVCGYRTKSIYKPIEGRPICKKCEALLAIMKD